MTTPVWKPWVRARKATAGVGTMPALSHGCAGLTEAGGECGGDPGTGLARVAAEKDFGLRRGFAQRMAEREADGEDGRGIERELPAMARMPSVPKSLRVVDAVIGSVSCFSFRIWARWVRAVWIPCGSGMCRLRGAWLAGRQH